MIAACGTRTVTLALDFPSERSFLLTETVDVAIVDSSDCLEALDALGGEPHRVLTETSSSACAARAGELVLDSVPHGRVAIVVSAFNPRASVTDPILIGCRVVEIDDDPPGRVDITLDFEDVYFPFETAVIAAGGPGCSTAEARCANTCTP